MSTEKASQLQMMQQNLQHLLIQKQQVESQILEIDSALEELGEASQAYKIVGKIMISASAEDLKKSLSEKKDILKIRLTTFEKQEHKLKENFEKAQKEVIERLKEKKC